MLVDHELNRRPGLQADVTNVVELQTAVSLKRGSLERGPIVPQAEEGEVPLKVEARLFVDDDREPENFQNYRGFVECVRFALGPSAAAFHVGSHS